MDHSTENLEQYSAGQQGGENKEVYTPRPKRQIILAWIMIAIVLFAFLGTCYWMVQYGRV